MAGSSATASSAGLPVAEARMVFHGVTYLLSLRSQAATPSRSPALHLSARSLDGSAAGEWGASFSASEIEAMSSKTGEFQPFGTMERMLARALSGAVGDGGTVEPHRTAWKHGANFDTLTMDLLTYEQLDALKARRNPDATASSSSSSQSGITPRSQARRNLNKRYLILTLSSTRSPDERIHYPLPLPFLAGEAGAAQGTSNGHAAAAAQAVAASHPKQQALTTDVTALRQQIAALTHSIHEQQEEEEKQLQQPLSHRKSLYHSTTSAESRERSRSPPRRSSHHSSGSRSAKSSSSSSSHSHSHSHSHSSKPDYRAPDAPLHASRADRLTMENAQLRSEINELRLLASSASAQSAGAPVPVQRKQGMHYIKNSHDPLEADMSSLDMEAEELIGSEAERERRLRALDVAAAHAASRTIEASEELIASLQSRLESARESAAFDAEVAAKRVQGLEQENRALRRSEAAAQAKVARCEEQLAELRAQHDELTQRFTQLQRSRPASAYMRGREPVSATSPSPAAARGRGRSASPVPNRTNAARSPSPGSNRSSTSALPPVRGASQSPARNVASPYLQAHRQAAINSGRSSPARSRGASPMGTGRGGVSPARSSSPSFVSRSSGGTVPPLPVARMRSVSPAASGVPRPRPASASPSRTLPARSPLDLSYRQYSVQRHDVKVTPPLRRFDPVTYVERKRAQLASKQAALHAKTEAAIARAASPARGRSPSPSAPASRRNTTGSLSLSASTPAFSFSHSPGRSGRSTDERPSGYVGHAGDRARSRKYPDGTPSRPTSATSMLSRSASLAADSFVPAPLPPDTPPTPPERLGHTRPMPRNDPTEVLFTTTHSLSTGAPHSEDDESLVARAARAAFREARTRELQLQQEEERARERRRKLDASIGISEEELAQTRAEEDAAARAMALAPTQAPPSSARAAQLRQHLEPNIPTLNGLGLEEGDMAATEGQIGGLTARLAKLQSYVAGERAA